MVQHEYDAQIVEASPDGALTWRPEFHLLSAHTYIVLPRVRIHVTLQTNKHVVKPWAA
jgi:hypothetical protein